MCAPSKILYTTPQCLRPSAMVPLCDSFLFLAFIWPPKAKRLCNSSAYGQRRTYYSKMIRIVLVYSARAHIIVDILRNNKVRQQDDGVLSSPISQGSDSGETPLFVGFSHLGSIVEQHWSPYGVYTHFLWHHVAEMMMNEPQSGTITFGLANV